MEKEELRPIGDESRIIPLWSYILFWWSALIVVQAFAVGFFGVYPVGPLNFVQAIVALLIASVLLAILWTLNSFPGYEEGIPYASQMVSSFGVRGAKIATVLRSIPAIAWLGIGNWIGATAILTITDTIWGFGNPWVYFVIFLILQTLLALKGIHTMKWFNTLAAIIIAVLMAYTVIVIVAQGDPIVQSESYLYPGSWGIEFWYVVAAAVAAVITGALNSSDVSRHLIKSKGSENNWAGHILGIFPPFYFMMLVGIIFGITAGVYDPVAAMMEVTPTLAAGVALLIFVLGAQISTNLALNFLPPTHALQDMTSKITWKIGILIVALLSVITFPWVLFTAGFFYVFLSFYGVFLGPVLGVALADYWVVNRRKIDVDALYDKDPGSKYWYSNGFSWAAIISLVVGSGASLFSMGLSWMIGLPIAFVLYILLKTTMEKT